MTSLARQLAGITGGAHVLTDPGLLAGYVTDWSGRYRGTAACVVRPGSAAEVAGVQPLSRRYPGYLLTEIPAGDAERLAAALPADTAVAQDSRGQAALWAYRERLTEAIAASGVPHKIDVAVPQARLGAFRAELDGAVRQAAGGADAAVLVFGHIGVGNLHVNVVGPDPGDEAVDLAAEIAAMRAIKSALDPAGLLNPGVLVAPNPPPASGFR